jgi:hypothetical protein
MVDIGDRHLEMYTINAHRLELRRTKRAVGVVHQHPIDLQGDLLPWPHLAVDEMCRDKAGAPMVYLFGKISTPSKSFNQQMTILTDCYA